MRKYSDSLSLQNPLTRLVVVWGLALALPVAAVAADWPQFRGPNRDGISTEEGLTETWGENGPPELWRVPIGPAYSSITVVGGRVYTMTSDEGHEYVAGYDASTGEELWRIPLGGLFENDYGNGPRSTPTWADGVLYSMGSLGTFAALRADDGEILWQHDLQRKFDSPLPIWAFTSSALVVGSSVLIEIGGSEGRTVAAFDRESGELIWTGGGGDTSYSSPILVDFGGGTQIVHLTKNGLMALTPDGETVWSSPFAPELGIKPAPPVFVAPDLIFASASYETGAKVVRLVSEGGSTSVEEVWQHRTMRNHFNGSVVVGDGHVCGFDKAFLKCLDAGTGEQTAIRRGFGKGSLIRADGKLVVLSERGKLVLLPARPDLGEELASHQVLSGRCWTQPSLAGGRLYLRNNSEMVALDLAER